jgi:hypothetical protein
MPNGEQEIDRLRRRLGWESGGPLGQISTQATDTVVSKTFLPVRPFAAESPTELPTNYRCPRARTLDLEPVWALLVRWKPEWMGGPGRGQ